MRFLPSALRRQRRTHYELYEERLALSAQPLGDFLLERDLTPVAQELETATASVHRSTGVDYVRSTFGLDGRGQTVAIIDTGIAYDHQALGGGLGAGYRVVGGWDFTEENDANPYDDGPAGFHGTHVAGIVGSSDANFPGVAPGVDLVGLRVFNDHGAGYFHWVEYALRWVHEHRFDFRNPITTVNLSIGTAWNSSTIPAWANLEDEFATLQADGIFVAVSAGNSFASYQSPGLSYPAASPSVVPVASINADGSLSSFSQRHDRVLAAPGVQITSTVPDHVYGSDGIPNDFGRASGTSMASPYVAGAAVLVRQAMEALGYQQITQSTIYDHLRNTADIVWDAVTKANYHRLNLRSALDQLIPDDDYGSTAATAHQLGTVSSATIEGLIGRVDDADYFTFTAAASGTMQLRTDSAPQLGLTVDVTGATAARDDQGWSFAVTAGQAYTVRLGAAGTIGRYSAQLELTTSAVELGAVDYQLLADQTLQGERWYQFTAAHTGGFTADAVFSHARGDLALEIYDAGRQLLAASNSASDYERVDAQVTAGQTYALRVRGSNPDADLRLLNLVSQSGSQVVVHGTSGNDVIELALGNTSRLIVQGVTYSLTAREFQLQGAAGTDRLVLCGTAADEQATIRVGALQWAGGAVLVTGSSFESVHLEGGAGQDSLELFDSSGNDELVITTAAARMSGAGYDHVASGFERVSAHASAGLQDRVSLYDTAGDDRFTADARGALLEGSAYRFYAAGFDRVYAFATAGGRDEATLYDSAGDDVFTAHPAWAQLEGSSLYAYASGFDRVTAVAQAGGRDAAFLYDSAGVDRLLSHADWSALYGTGFYLKAQHFERVEAFSQGSQDRADLYDSAGNDRFISRGDQATLEGAGVVRTAHAFARVYASAVFGGAEDEALLFHPEGRGPLNRSSAWIYSHPGEGIHAAKGFDRIFAGIEAEHAIRRSATSHSAVGAHSSSPVSAEPAENASPALQRTWAVFSRFERTDQSLGSEVEQAEPVRRAQAVQLCLGSNPWELDVYTRRAEPATAGSSAGPRVSFGPADELQLVAQVFEALGKP